MKEIWFYLRSSTDKVYNNTIIALSNKGRLKRNNGAIENTSLRQGMRINNKHYLLYRLIADEFLPKTKEDKKLNRNCVDHITHNPKNININDVRNLRRCTHKENMSFEETRKKRSESAKGKVLSEETRRKISKAVSGKNHPLYGKHPSKETLKKLSESHKGFKVSEETKLKISKSHKGKFKSYFGREYIKHFKMCRADDLKKYMREYQIYKSIGKLSWK